MQYPARIIGLWWSTKTSPPVRTTMKGRTSPAVPWRQPKLANRGARSISLSPTSAPDVLCVSISERVPPSPTSWRSERGRSADHGSRVEVRNSRDLGRRSNLQLRNRNIGSGRDRRIRLRIAPPEPNDHCHILGINHVSAAREKVGI